MSASLIEPKKFPSRRGVKLRPVTVLSPLDQQALRISPLSHRDTQVSKNSICRQIWPNFYVVGDVPCELFFARIDRPMNTLQLCRWQYIHKKLCGRLSTGEVQFYTKKTVLLYSATLWGTNRQHTNTMFILDSLKSDFPLVLIELSLARYYGSGTTSKSIENWTSLEQGQLDAKFQVEEFAPHQPYFLSEN